MERLRSLIIVLFLFGCHGNDSIDYDRGNNHANNTVQKNENNANRYFRNNWQDYIKVKSTYKVGAFGGISDARITVSNTTQFVIDQLKVSVDIVKENGEVHKTDYIIFENLAPGLEETKAGNNSGRGQSMKLKFYSIRSQGLNFCYPNNNGNSEDPFYCQ